MLLRRGSNILSTAPAASFTLVAMLKPYQYRAMILKNLPLGGRWSSHCVGRG
jgi:hypothetical protein